MKPSEIFKVLDLALEVRKQGRTFNPLFVGPAGVGKSEIVQAWCKQKELPFVDLRAAYLESPDVIGFPKVSLNEDGHEVTKHVTPDIWPTSGQGVIFLDEVNRGQTAVLNTFMQLLTDRKIHKYALPEGWIIVSAINPESGSYDINTMDAALKNRFAMFEVNYDKATFVEYMKSKKFDETLVSFIESGVWVYVQPEDVQEKSGVKYISPRTFSMLNNAIKGGLSEDTEMPVLESLLGHNVAKAFLQFKRNDSPVMFDDFKTKKGREAAIKRLKEQSDPNNFKGGHISVTVSDLIKNYKKVDEDLLAELCLALPADQSMGLVQKLEEVNEGKEILIPLFENHPEVKKHIRSMINVKKT